MHVGGLWRDEVNLITISGRHTFGEMAKDSFPVVMPLAVHTWMVIGLGSSNLSLRILGLLVGLSILTVLWVASWKIRRAPPLLGLALFALNSSLVFFGDSLRAYGLGSLLAAAFMASAFIFLQQPSPRRAIWVTLFAILSVQVLYTNAVLVAAVCFGAWAVCWRRKDARAALQILFGAVISALSLLPYTHNLIANTTTSVILRSGVELPRFFASYRDTLGYPFSGYLYVWIVLYAAIVFYACLGFRAKEAPTEPAVGIPPHDFNLFAAVALTIAGVGFPVFFRVAQLPMQSWYILPFMAGAAVCFDAVLPVFRGLKRAIAFGFIAATALAAALTTDGIVKQHFSDVDLYAQRLTAAAEPNDYIIVDPWLFGITFNYYYKGTTPWDTLPPLTDHSLHRFDLVQLQLQNTNAIAPVLQHIAQTLQSGHHVWILAAKGWMGIPNPGQGPPPTLPPAPLKDTGWADWPYTQVWAAQVACFTADHSTQFSQLKGLSNERFITEDMVAFVADGWKTNSIVP